MIIPIKTLKKLRTGESSFSVDIDDTATVDDLKAKIEAQCGKDDFPAPDQSLIYAGKILQPTDKLADCKIDPKKFVVLMINRQAPQPAPPADASSRQDSTAKQAAKPKQATTQQTSSTPPAASQQPQPQAQHATTPQVPAHQTIAASVQQPQQQQPPVSRPAHRDLSSDASMAARLGLLSSQPQFRQLQHLVQQNPHLLSSTIEALAESNPELYHFISDNPDAFVSALNQPIVERQRSGNHPAQPATRREVPGVLDLISNITQQDKEAIGRLKELGFSEDMAAQAYMACNKDENLAANLLFQWD